MSIEALLETLPTDKNALRFWALQRHSATDIHALVTKGIIVAK
jgi:hypothetical protein